MPETGKRSASTALSKETRFRLKSGDHLDRSQAPNISGRSFTITAKFDAQGRNGVIIAHGGAARGYTLFLQDGKLTFLLRTSEQNASSATLENVSGSHTSTARIESDGKLTLALDDGRTASAKGPALIKTMPVDGLEVGSDAGGLVGPYSAENKFNGTIEQVVIELN
jgi:arylsulfatase